MSEDLQRNTNGSCATTRKPSDSTETCGLGDSAALTIPIRTKPAYQMNAVVLTSSIPARKAAAVTAGKMKRLSGYMPPVPGSAIFWRKTASIKTEAHSRKPDRATGHGAPFVNVISVIKVLSAVRLGFNAG